MLRRLPNEKIVYFADSAHVPYGERPLHEIEEFALGITQFLIDQGAKAVVMACNMSSAVALDAARAAFPQIPILGVIEPGSRAAVSNGSRVIGVLATTGTVKSGAYSRTILTLAPRVKVYEQPCPAFVPLVESGMTDSEEAEIAARSCVMPLMSAGTDTLVLGCTHYPFLRKMIERAAPEAAIIDPAEETVRALDKILKDNAMQAGSDEPGEHRFFSSGDPEGFARLGSRLLGREIAKAEHAGWGVDLALPAGQRMQNEK
jgi:glutamate racemase